MDAIAFKTSETGRTTCRRRNEDDFDDDDDDAENWEDCLLHARGVLDDDIAKTIFAEDFANVVTRICVWF